MFTKILKVTGKIKENSSNKKEKQAITTQFYNFWQVQQFDIGKIRLTRIEKN